MTRRGILAAFAALATAPAVAAPRSAPRTLLVAGQSLAERWAIPSVQEAFRESAGQDWRIEVAASDGSSVRRLTSSDNYWVEDDGRPGPVMRDALVKVRGMGCRPDAIVWAQGQAEGLFYRPGRANPQQYVKDYEEAVLGLLRSLRQACAGPDWRSIPVYIQTVGWRTDPATDEGHELIRVAQMRLVAYQGGRHNLHLGAVQVPWNIPPDGVHPSEDEACMLARQTARAMKEAGR